MVTKAEKETRKWLQKAEIARREMVSEAWDLAHATEADRAGTQFVSNTREAQLMRMLEVMKFRTQEMIWIMPQLILNNLGVPRHTFDEDSKSSFNSRFAELLQTNQEDGNKVKKHV